METFEQIWESSRTNSASWTYAATLWSGACLLVALCVIKNHWLRGIGTLVVITVFSMMAIDFSMQEIQEKWRIRRDWADSHPAQMTEDGYHALAGDGANLTLGPLLYGFQAFLLFTGIAVVLSILRRVIVSRRTGKMVDTGADATPNDTVLVSGTPCHPPHTAS